MNDLIPWIFNVLRITWTFITSSWLLSWGFIITFLGFVLDIYFEKED